MDALAWADGADGGGDEGAEFEEGRGVRPQVEDMDAVLLTF